jgi:hypothetical protein
MNFARLLQFEMVLEIEFRNEKRHWVKSSNNTARTWVSRHVAMLAGMALAGQSGLGGERDWTGWR